MTALTAATIIVFAIVVGCNIYTMVLQKRMARLLDGDRRPSPAAYAAIPPPSCRTRWS